VKPDDRSVLLRLIADAIYHHVKGDPDMLGAASLRMSRQRNMRSANALQSSVITLDEIERITI
jgi:hypothetical protein